MGSADWMPRNLERRVEIMFPIEEEELKHKVMHLLQVQLDDTMKARVLTADGTYERIDKRGKESVCAQDQFCQEAMQAVKSMKENMNARIFVPEEHIEE